MKIDINKDFEKAFPDDLWKGFTLKQIITFAIGIIMAAGAIAALWKFMKISPITGSYIAIPVMWKEMRFYRATKKLTYGAEEAPKTGRIFTMRHPAVKKKKRKKK